MRALLLGRFAASRLLRRTAPRNFNNKTTRLEYHSRALEEEGGKEGGGGGYATAG